MLLWVPWNQGSVCVDDDKPCNNGCTRRSLLEPIRKVAARVHGHFLEAKATDIDLDNKLLEVRSVDDEDRFYVPYDKLVIAVGAQSITHGVEGLENTVQLKTVQDAINIRRNVMGNAEKACLPTTTPQERKQLLSFVICGGGPTGIEFAAELFDWINEDLVKWVSYYYMYIFVVGDHHA